jgi:hypothetical protein
VNGSQQAVPSSGTATAEAAFARDRDDTLSLSLLSGSAPFTWSEAEPAGSASSLAVLWLEVFSLCESSTTASTQRNTLVVSYSVPLHQVSEDHGQRTDRNVPSHKDPGF